ncbi:MAG: ribosome-associated translation inhibitor RaiA [Firmicutes bacterium]|nr:ribosome-associated translation inhibitor RaiA [Bacillota bacterium]MCD7831242.1 ribosome-associated translation inhibitor RaiA [Bacillota bacterium]MCD8314773.1 ribosome-associated translation inhibitor RaiA [Bacillota bacterium]
MKTTIIGKQMNVSADLKALVTKKLSKFDKFFGDDAEAFVSFNRRHGQECLEVTISANGTLFRAEKKNTTFNNAIDECMEVIERQIRKNKTRLERRLRDGAFSPYDGEISGFMSEEESDEIITRTKKFPIKPMTPDEAILQMNLLDHSFFVFVDQDSEETCVVYKRDDGNYGLIVPER